MKRISIFPAAVLVAMALGCGEGVSDEPGVSSEAILTVPGGDDSPVLAATCGGSYQQYSCKIAWSYNEPLCPPNNIGYGYDTHTQRKFWNGSTYLYWLSTSYTSTNTKCSPNTTTCHDATCW